MLEIHNLLKEQLPRVETWQRPFIPEMGLEVAEKSRCGIPGRRQQIQR